jgi:hypothetical protein
MLESCGDHQAISRHDSDLPALPARPRVILRGLSGRSWRKAVVRLMSDLWNAFERPSVIARSSAVPSSEGISSLAANLQAPRAPELDSRKPEIQLRSRQDRPERVAGRPSVEQEAHQAPSTPFGFRPRNVEWKPPASSQPRFGSSRFPGDQIVRQGPVLILPPGQPGRGTNARICRYPIRRQSHSVSLEPRLSRG